MPFKDSEKRKEYRREWYNKNKDSEKQHVKRRKKDIRLWLIKHKETLKCSLCGEKHPATLDFHHSNKKKDFEISYMVGNGYSVNRIKKELDKCIVLCSNCHRKEHYNNKKL